MRQNMNATEKVDKGPQSITQRIANAAAKRAAKLAAIEAVAPVSTQKLLVELALALPANASVRMDVRAAQAVVAVPFAHQLASASWCSGVTVGDTARLTFGLPLSDAAIAGITAFLRPTSATCSPPSAEVPAVAAPEPKRRARKAAKGGA